MYPSKQQFYSKHINIIRIRLFCGSIATCFDPAGSSSGNHYMNMPFAIELFTDMDPDR
jgi:hypothetical protein